MLTEDEFAKRWKRCTKRQKKYIANYIENGFDPYLAATQSGYTGVSLKNPVVRIQRRVDDIIDYLIVKNNIVNALIKPAWVMENYKKIFDNTNSEITKIQILNQLSKILQMQSDAAKIEVNNNIPQTPVQIVFNDED
jgi:hypothetical protein